MENEAKMMDLLQQDLTSIRLQNEQIQTLNAELSELNERKAQKIFKIIDLITSGEENASIQGEWVIELLQNDEDFDDYFKQELKTKLDTLQT